MPDKFHIHFRASIDFFFEWKDDEHLIDKLFNLFDTALSPCPYLRADVVEDRSACLLNALRQPQIEIGKIDEDCCGRRLALNVFGQMVEHPIESPEMTNNLERPDNSCLLDIAFQLNAGLAHPLATES